MNALAGTRQLMRLAWRLDRVRIPVWVLLIGLMPLLTASNYKKLYPTAQSLRAVENVLANKSLVALNGPLFGLSLGGLTAWKIGVTSFIAVALMSLLTVIRHTRTEEESGRLELLGATVVGRYAPLTAAVCFAGLANLAIMVVIWLGLLSAGMPAAGSSGLAVAVGLFGLAFTAVGALAAQLTSGARSATGIAGGVLGGVFLLRALGDTGPQWLSWMSPMGWAMRMRPFAGDRWWVTLPLLALTALLGVAGYLLVGRRDIGAGLLPQRRGRAEAAAGLGSAWGLAWRLHRGVLIGWLVALLVTGAVLGGAAGGIADGFAGNDRLNEMLARMGGRKGLTDMYLATVFGIVGLTAAAYTVQATLRMRAEETAGRVEALLATPVGRLRWVASHLLFALFGTALLLLAAGVSGGLAYGVQEHDVAGQVGRLTGAALVQLPATWVMAGLGMALFGLVPRLAQLTWAALIACFLLLELGALLGLSQWIVDVSPFAHVPKLPGSPLPGTPMVALVAVAAALTGAGLAAFRRRDIG